MTATGLATERPFDLAFPVSSPQTSETPEPREEHGDGPTRSGEGREQTLTPEAIEEDLVTDVRASLTPAQMVERKLVSLLKSNPLPVSHLMTGPRTFRGR
jgi:hypothetical protein